MIKNLMKNIEQLKYREKRIIDINKRAAVFILIDNIDGIDYIIFERRANTLKSQPGDISLVGGKIDEGESAFDAAYREVYEEIGVVKEDIEYLFENDLFVSPYRTSVNSFVGRINNPTLKPNPSEVEELVLIPLSFFIENEPLIHHIDIEPRPSEDFPYDLIVSGRDYKFMRGKYIQYFYKYEDVTVWGTTAALIRNFISLIKQIDSNN